MAIKRKTRTAETNADAWMLTFSDLMMLILTFFVLRYSMSSMEGRTFKERFQTVKGLVPEAQLSLPASLELISPVLRAPQSEVAGAIADGLAERLGYPAVSGESGGSYTFRGSIVLRPRTEGVLVEVGSSGFVAGSDELTFLAREGLSALGKSLRGKAVALEIAGHTDDRQVPEPRFASAWELSRSKALAVARQIIDAGVEPQSLSVVGYSGTKPIASNETAVGRHQNRRVEIRIESRETGSASSR